MPLTYAHYRFGQKCLSKLPLDLQNIINKNIDYYNYGCQGPDIFYYYNLTKENKIKEFGKNLHTSKMIDILEMFKFNIKKIKNRDAALAYIIGFISHFLLDSYCNAYIYKASNETNINVKIIYKEIEKYYYYKDKLNKYNISSIFKPSKDIVAMLSTLFNNFKESTYKQIIYDYKTKLFLLKDGNYYKDKAILLFAKLTSNKEIEDNILNEKTMECLPFCVRCDKYFEIATVHFPVLINNYMDYLTKNSPLNKYYEHNFKTKNNINNIPILNIKDEENYVLYDFQD